MVTTVTDTTFASTYKDDYRDSDNYHRILFNSGRAVQARELTQMQTIIQNEIARFARNIFTDGAVVSSGGTTVNNRLEYVKLDTALFPAPANINDLVGKVFTVSPPDSPIQFQVLRAEAAVGSDPATLYIKYTDTTAGTAGALPIRVPNAARFTAAGGIVLKAVNADATGVGTLASVQRGEFFVQDHFVFAPEQTIFLSKYSSTPTVELGFKTVQEIVTAEDDAALYDNQGATPNLTAPGADRYRIRLILSNKADLDSDENFVLIAKVTNGLITKVVTPYDNYNQINEVMAKRTKEESGNYVVQNFIAKFDDLDDSNLALDVSGGIAYVDGYRLDIAPTKISVPKARDTLEAENEIIIPQYGNYVLGRLDNTNLPDISTFDKINLRTDSSYGGTTIGTARVRAIEENDGSSLKYYLFDINMGIGQSFRDTRSFGNSGADYVNVRTDGGIANLVSNTTKNNLLFELPRSRPAINGVSDLVLTVQKRYTFTATSSTYTIPAGGTDIFTNPSDWIISPTGGSVAEISPSYTLIGTPTGSQVQMSGLTNGVTYVLMAYVILDNPQIRQKTLSPSSITVSWPNDAESDGFGTQYIDLGEADIYRVDRIRKNDSDGTDLSSNFIFDNGQRDNYYGLGRLLAKSGRSIPSGDIYVKYQYFQHGAGDLFAVNSYTGAVSYENIPSYNNISLRDVLDFRPIQSADGNFVANNINLLPQNLDALIADVVYYLPRKDLLVVKSIDASGQLGVGDLVIQQGISSENPVVPEDPANGMSIYTISINPYTISDSDVTLTAIDNKRYTMKDISRLESRLNKLAEVTSLSLLELDTSTLVTLDSNGLDRTKSGFFADNFEDFTFSDLDDPTYRASREPNAKVMTPAIEYGSVRLFYDSDNIAQTAVRHGDIVTLPYTETEFAFQNVANEAINVNPFEVIINTGTLQLSPASDDWIETYYLPDTYVSGGVKKRNIGTRTVVKRTLGGWFGVALAVASFATGFGALVSSGLTLGGATVGSAIGLAGAGYWAGFGLAVASSAASAANVVDDLNKVSIASNEAVVRDDVIIKQISDKVLRVDQIPYMRSIKVHFKAEGLKPNQEHFPFFGGTRVSDWCKQEPFVRFSADPVTYGNTLIDANGHPDGTSRLITNAEGRIEGSFVIPSSKNLKFRTGTKIFKLSNITVDNDDAATSLCQTIFTSAGVLETRQKTLKATREIDVQTVVIKKKSIFCFWDPLAQSFLVSPAENPSGIFVTSIDVFFKSKAAPGGQTVQVQLRGMENGSPLPYPLPGAVAYLSPEQVNLPADVNNLASVRSAPTRFTFDEPIFLSPGQEYSIVVASETTDYEVYAAKTYDFVLGSTEARVTKQPSLGSLFKSQNGTTWTPDQNRDLMFRINRAVFETTGQAFLRNLDPPLQLLNADPFLTDSASFSVRVFHEGHGFVRNDIVTIRGLDSAETYGDIRGSSILGERAITSADWSGYTFNADSASQGEFRTGGDRVVVDRQIMFNSFYPNLELLLPNNTSIGSEARFTQGASWASDRNSVTNSAYGINNYQPIILNNTVATNTPMIIPNAKNKATNLSGQDPVLLRLSLFTDDDKVSPIIDLQRASMTTVENMIDRQAPSASSGFNVPIEYVDETDPYNGSAASKHISTVSTLVEPAVGLKIMFSGYRPFEANFKVYYRTSPDGSDIYDRPWVYIDQPNIAADLTSFREYSYLVGGEGGTLPAFESYQVKIVMETTDTSKIPVIKDLRVIALAV